MNHVAYGFAVYGFAGINASSSLKDIIARNATKRAWWVPG
jgi:hypothetical protein